MLDVLGRGGAGSPRPLHVGPLFEKLWLTKQQVHTVQVQVQGVVKNLFFKISLPLLVEDHLVPLFMYSLKDKRPKIQNCW